MEKFPRELFEPILQQCDLETLISLRHVSKTLYDTVNSFDDLIRPKVLKRAPWFVTDSGIDSWNKCALVLLARTKQSLTSPDWTLVHSFEAAMNTPTDTEYVKPSDFYPLPQESQLLFPEATLKSPGTWHFKGTKLLTRGMQLDMNTLTTSPCNYNPDSMLNLPSSKLEVTSPSGLKVRSSDGKRVQVLDENDNLLLVRLQTRPDSLHEEDEGEDPEWTFVLDDEEYVVYKDSCVRDEDGALIIDRTKLPYVDTPGIFGKAFFKLVPGSGGAIMTKYYIAVNSYIAYIEPTAEMRQVIITFLPHLRFPQNIEYEDFHPKNYILYNGYLYYYFEGRLLRLWVDFGIEKRLDKRMVFRGEQEYYTQCLTSISKKFAALGTFSEQSHGYDCHILHQSADKRYVTVHRAGGYVVGDLETGKTYRVDEFSFQKYVMIPSMQDGKVKFNRLHSHISKGLQKAMHQQYANRHKKFSLKKVCASLLTSPDYVAVQAENRTFIRRPLYYWYGDDITYAMFGPYLKPQPTPKRVFGVPILYKNSERLRSDWKSAPYIKEGIDELAPMGDVYDERYNENMYKRQEAHRAILWCQMYEGLYKSFGSQVTNDPEDPKNLQVFKRFHAGVDKGVHAFGPIDPGLDGNTPFGFGYTCARGNPNGLDAGPPEMLGVDKYFRM